MEAIGTKIKNLEELISLRQETVERSRSVADFNESRANKISIQFFKLNF